jgi:hypothetical protein
MQKQNDGIYQDHTGNWNHPKNIENIPQQHAWKVWHQGSKDNSRVGHCAVASESGNAKKKNPPKWEVTLHVSHTVTTK